MADAERLLVEQDETVARVAETALRMMAGSVGPETLRAIRDELRAHPDAYPWQRVCDLVVAEPVDPSALVNGAIVAQRDWVQRGRPPVPGGPAAAGTARPPRSASLAGKRILAILIVRGGFYLAYAAAFLVLLVLLERKWGLDIYRIGRAVEEFVRGLLG